MFILAIDTSCDETSVAVTWNDVVLSNVLSSQVELHKKYGGVVPFLAQRMHREKIDAVIQEAIKRAGTQVKKMCHSVLDTESKNKKQKQKDLRSFNSLFSFLDSRFRGNDGIRLEDIGCFAVTHGPGLAPALQVGVEKAQELAKRYKKPLVAVNHMEGHIYANFSRKIGVMTNDKLQILKQHRKTLRQAQDDKMVIKFPLLCLLVSGNHTEIVLMNSHGKYQILGETLDDACGEAFDKVGRMLSLGYPAGPLVEQLAKEGDPFQYSFPVPLAKSKVLDFSYSGLKTSVLYTLQKISPKGQFTKKQICDVCASFQRAAVEHLVQKTVRAVKQLTTNHYSLTTLLLGGGVVANKLVRTELRKAMKPFGIQVVYPNDKKLLGDNAAMIAVAASYKAKRKEFVKNVSRLERNPSLRLGN